MSLQQGELGDSQAPNRPRAGQLGRPQQPDERTCGNRHAEADRTPAPGLPAKTFAIRVSSTRSGGVYPACGLVGPANCSVNVTAGLRGTPQSNRRTNTSITTGTPSAGASAVAAHSGHAPGGTRSRGESTVSAASRKRTRMLNMLAHRSAASTTAPDRGGSTRFKSPEPRT
jgi:hypothetical protein